MVMDGEGRVVFAGQVPLKGDASFHVDLKGRLPSGQFTLHAQIIVNGNAAASEIKRVSIAVPPPP